MDEEGGARMTRACNVGDGDECRPPTPDAAVLDGGLTKYPGGKNGAGVWQRLISLMPPHRAYFEMFLGSGAIMRRKRRAAANVGFDADAAVIQRHANDAAMQGVSLSCSDALYWLRRYTGFSSDTLVYCDPPYLGESRGDERPRYKYEMLDELQHRHFLQLATSIPAMVMISGYPSALYDEALKGWRRLEYTAQTRGGPKREVVWMNYPEPTELHDYRFLGADYHDRCRLKRKISRWASRLQSLPALERSAILAALKGEA